jgi:hypothetical protein
MISNSLSGLLDDRCKKIVMKTLLSPSDEYVASLKEHYGFGISYRRLTDPEEEWQYELTLRRLG